MFDVRGLNIAVELWGVAFCTLGIASMLLMARADLTCADRNFRNHLVAMFLLELLSSGGDALAGLYRGMLGSGAVLATHVGNFVSFASYFILLAVFTSYLSARLYEVRAQHDLAWPKAVWAWALVMCVLTAQGAFYGIDENNLYYRTPHHWMMYLFPFVVCVVDMVLTLRRRRQLGRAACTCLLFYSLSPLVAACIQSQVYGINSMAIACVLAIMILFLEVQAHSVQKLVNRTEELARSQVELSESRIQVMLSQIQPHFLFNTLDTIYGLVDEDTELAKDAISGFSRYLRTNLATLGKKEPVPIETELRHVRTYLELEKVSDEDALTYELDTPVLGFKVPALSIQTLVENAAKHGVGQREQGGAIVVRTSETKDHYVVTIADNGVGFDPAAIDKSESHLGISNTRARLEALCAGTLEVTSEVGVGTTVKMLLPKEVELS